MQMEPNLRCASRSILCALILLLTTGAGIVRCDGVFNVRKFGAVGDGKTVDTIAVRAATKALASAGGGTLLFPALSASGAATYLTGPFNLSSNTFMQVDESVTVLGTSGLRGDWPLVVAKTVWPQFGHGSDCTPGTEQCRLMHQGKSFLRNCIQIELMCTQLPFACIFL